MSEKLLIRSIESRIVGLDPTVSLDLDKDNKPKIVFVPASKRFSFLVKDELNKVRVWISPKPMTEEEANDLVFIAVSNNTPKVNPTLAKFYIACYTCWLEQSKEQKHESSTKN